MKKTLSLVLSLMLMVSFLTPAMADSLLPYTGEQVTYTGYAADLGIKENREAPITKAYIETTGNVAINWSTAPWADFDQKTAQFLNTGDLPDIVWLRNAPAVVANYGSMGYFLNFMDYIDYMPNLKANLEEFPHLSSVKDDTGALYCLQDVEPTDYVDESFFVNKTELDKLGLNAPTTWEEMLAAMRAYKAANPEGTPFITYGWGQNYYMYCLAAIGAVKRNFYYDGTKWTHALLEKDSGFQGLIERMHTMYTEGLLHPEFSTMSDEQAYQIVQDGNWLFSFFYMNAITREILLDQPADFEYEAIFAPALEEGGTRYSVVTVPYDNVPSWGYFVNAKVQNPELICAYLDNVISREASLLYNWGIEGVSFETTATGGRAYLDGYKTRDERRDAGVGNFMDVRYISWKMRDVDYYGGTDQSRAAYDKIVGGLISGELTGIRALRGRPSFTAAENETIGRSVTPMNTYIDENLLTFIDGSRPLTEWEDFVTETLGLGNMDEVLQTYENAKQIIHSAETRYVSYN